VLVIGVIDVDVAGLGGMGIGKGKADGVATLESYFTYGRSPDTRIRFRARDQVLSPSCRVETVGFQLHPRQNRYVLASALSRIGFEWVKPRCPDVFVEIVASGSHEVMSSGFLVTR
jgi:hypothetical protein